MMMQTGSGQYKTLSAECEIAVRRMSPERSDPRLISSFRKPNRTAAGFVVTLAQAYPVNTLVELDVKFPGQPFTYRSRGVVAWVEESGNPEKPHRLGITVFGMKKLGASDSVIPEPPKRAAEETAPRVTTVQSEETQTSLLTPMPASAASSAGEDVLEKQLGVPAASDLGAGTAAEGAASVGSPGPAQEVMPLPKQKDIAALLTNLLGESVAVKQSTEASPEPDTFAALGSFVTDDDEILALLAMDLDLCNWLGAAIAMVPATVAKEEILKANLSEETMENLQEILNIAASVFNKPKVPHLKFATLHLNEDAELPYQVTKIMKAPAAQADFKVEVPNYGSGLLSCIFGSYAGPV